MQNKRTIAIIFFIVLFSLGCQNNKPLKEGSTVNNTLKDKTHEVNTYVTKIINFNYLIQATGKIKAFNEQKILAEYSGVVKLFNLKAGSTVNKGAILLTLDNKEILLRIEKVNEIIFSSGLNYRSDLLNQESLLRGKSKGIRDTVFRKLKSNSGLSTAEIELKELQFELEKTVIRAPFSGTLADINVQRGQYVRTGDAIATIYSHNELFLEVKVLETDLRNIRVGQIAELSPISSMSKSKATVTEINPLVDENGMISVRLRINQTKGLLPGMNAISTVYAPEEKALVVPKRAVVVHNDRSVVFTFENGLAKWNYVTLGRDNGEEVEIISGLTEGQKVIISNNLQLVHDTPVKEVN